MPKYATYILVGAAAAAIIATRALAGAPSPSPAAPLDLTHGDRTSDASVDGAGAKRLVIDIPLAELKIVTTGRGNRLTAHAVRSCKLPTSPSGLKWLNDSVFTVERRGDELFVQDKPFGSHSLKGADGEDGLNPRFVVELSVPVGLDVKLDLSVGSAQAAGHYGRFDGSVKAGQLSATGIDCSGPLQLHTGAGKIDATLAAPLRSDSRLESGVGGLTIDLPRGSNMLVKADVGVGHISGLPEPSHMDGGIRMGARREAQIGRGGTSLVLHAGVGQIEVGVHDAVSDATPTTKARSLDEGDTVAAVRDDSNEEDAPEVSEDIPVHIDADVVDFHAFGRSEDDLVDSKAIEAEVRKAIKLANVEVKKALAEARREMRAAMAELDRKGFDGKKGKRSFKDLGIDDKELSKSIEATVRAALETARAATDAALHAADAAVKSESDKRKEGDD